MVPILTTLLVGVATKVGIGLATTVAKRLFGREPAATTAAEPQQTFAQELERARPLPTVDAPIAPAAAVPGVALRAPEGGVVRPTDSVLPLTTERAQLALATRGGRRRGGPLMSRLGRHHLGAYRRLDLGPR